MNELFTYWRSSCSYRVRIALNLKGLDYRSIPIHLMKDGGEQRQSEYRAQNPQGLVPLWAEDGWRLGQSLAIMEYLDERFPNPPLLPADPRSRAEVRALAQSIACEIQPLNNLRVLQHLKRNLAQSQEQVNEWIRHWIASGFEALEATLRQTAGRCCFEDQPTLADCCLVPQVYSARRFDCDLSNYPTLMRVNDTLVEMDAFQRASPEQQPDAE